MRSHVHARGHALHQLDGAGRAGHHALAQRAQIEAVEFGMLQLRHVHGGHAVERRWRARDATASQRGQRRRTAPRAESAWRRTPRDTMRADHRAEAMVQRHRRADAVVSLAFSTRPMRHAVVDQAAMRQQHALGRAGGAGGVLDVGDVVGGPLARPEIRSRRRSSRPTKRSPSQTTCSSGSASPLRDSARISR